MGSDLAGHDGTKMPSSIHLYPSTDYAQFSIRAAVGAYSIHSGIDCLGTSTDDIYSIDGIYSTDRYIIQPDISRSLSYGTRVEPLASGDGLLRCRGKVPDVNGTNHCIRPMAVVKKLLL
ncbi:hypothetical protein COCNU_01G015990 [Cocos nucifera]|uniref:Uncharacterized protein n=1 Tax=Cocos nucifera TaxID=13894 RepID=A0A8K0HWU7_COCNU|nr:hypothetical protein COCNU_01G015990 [Cocos nucifera]